MTQNKKIIVGVSIAVAATGIGYLLYRRNVNKTNSSLLLEYITTLPKENTAASQAQIHNQISDSVINQINSTSVSALNGKTVVFDGKYYTVSSNNKQLTEKAVAIVTGLYESMKGANILSNVDEFMKYFSRIGNKNAMVYINMLYKLIYKETMWQAIHGEKWLYLGSSKSLDIFNVADGLNYHPAITNHLAKLK